MPEEVCGTWTPEVLPVDNVACKYIFVLELSDTSEKIPETSSKQEEVR